MKKKALLVFTLAAVSAAALAAAGCSKGDKDNTPPHKHSYTWVTTDPDNHWQACECGARKDEGNHIDIKINADNSDGADGVCDVCGRTLGSADDPNDPDAPKSYSVSFNMLGHGTAPKVQTVLSGEKATPPASPEADGYDFIGWYKESACTNPFNFSEEPITANTVVYAKWEKAPDVENTNPGETVRYAIELVKGGDGLTMYDFATVKKMYFKYTATENGRYMLSFISRNPNTNKCRFTTNLDAADVYYGADEALAGDEKHFDLEKGQTVLITVDCPAPEKLAANASGNKMVYGVLIGDSNGEVIPESWTSGTYTNGVMKFKLDCDARELEMDGKTYTVNYMGGKYHDSVTFSSTDGKDYTIKLGASPNTLSFTYPYMNSTKTVTMRLYQTPTAIPLADFAGKYTYADISLANIKEFTIYPNGNGSSTPTSGTMSKYSITAGTATFTQADNELRYGNYVIWLNVVDTVTENEDGTTEVVYTNGYSETLAAGTDTSGYVAGARISITVVNTVDGSFADYTRTGECGDEVPAKLPLPDNITLTGSVEDEDENVLTYTIICKDGVQWWGSVNTFRVDVTNYVSATGVYTIKANSVTYTLTISEGADGPEVELTNAKGLTVTLKAPVLSGTPLLTVGAETVVEKSEFNASKEVFFKVQEAGYYQFVSPLDLVIYYNSDNDYVFISDNVPSSAVYIEKDFVITVNADNVYGWVTLDKVRFTANTAEEPKGTLTNPYTLTGTGTLENIDIEWGEDGYVKFTAPAAGTYKLCFSYNFWGTTSYQVHYSIDGTDYGYHNYNWVGGVTAEDPWLTVTVAAGSLDVIIKVEGNGNAFKLEVQAV